MKTHNAIYE